MAKLLQAMYDNKNKNSIFLFLETYIFEHSEMIEEKDYLTLKQIPDGLSTFGLRPREGLAAGQEPGGRVHVLGREGHAVDQVTPGALSAAFPPVWRGFMLLFLFGVSVGVLPVVVKALDAALEGVEAALVLQQRPLGATVGHPRRTARRPTAYI